MIEQYLSNINKIATVSIKKIDLKNERQSKRDRKWEKFQRRTRAPCVLAPQAQSWEHPNLTFSL